MTAIVTVAGSAVAEPALRYDFAVGDRLVYERRVRVLPLAGEAVLERYSEQLQLTCLSRDLKKAYILAEIIRIVDQQTEPAHGALFHVDHRGRTRMVGEILARVSELDPVFELLPTLPAALDTGDSWLTEPDHFGRCRRCTRAAPDADGLVRIDFVLEDPTGVSDARGDSQRGVCWFDPTAGIVTRVESEWTDRHAERRILAVARLHTRLKQEPLWCQRRIGEVDDFLRTLRLEDRLVDQITSESERVEEILAYVDRLWSELIAEMPDRPESPVRRLARARRKIFAERADRYRERAVLAQQWLGATAAHWSLQTPEGETLRSEALRDRYVIECFWSEDSLWSLRSLETLRRVQKELPAEEFRVVCLNIDADVVAARRAARLCGKGLTHVLSGPPVGGTPPRELPVFRVLGRDSRVLGVLFGWQPGLGEKVSSVVR
jgi:hypothetical protein